ncbi:hypothetical protein BI292_21670 [Pseudomonas sp. 43NM1]|uniref:hypothetical protein n=1 Tax=Pseudomonas sp. 43NM1 TaxID=1904755 RepID=UPI000C34C4AA|nr:hypothetical protein [Pseudomonas sp. 43NM1]PKH13039.1 hypothetical protein BI292_21670 [Pseudomonas sp. 43NM1]
MKHTDLTLLFIAFLSSVNAAHADDLFTPIERSSIEILYYGADQPFANPAPFTLNAVPPRAYISTAPQDFIPVASDHVFYDSRLPTVADSTVRVFIRSYDAQRGIYVNDEVLDPTCLLACLAPQGPALP